MGDTKILGRQPPVEVTFKLRIRVSRRQSSKCGVGVMKWEPGVGCAERIIIRCPGLGYGDLRPMWLKWVVELKRNSVSVSGCRNETPQIGWLTSLSSGRSRCPQGGSHSEASPGLVGGRHLATYTGRGRVSVLVSSHKGTNPIKPEPHHHDPT